MLNTTEKQNVETILAYEKARGESMKQIHCCCLAIIVCVVMNFVRTMNESRGKNDEKKLALVLAALTLFCGMLPVAGAALSNFAQQRTYAGQFVDVAANAWYYDNVKTAYELGLVNGSSDTTYSPEDNITVAEVQTLVARIHATYHGNTILLSLGLGIRRMWNIAWSILTARFAPWHLCRMAM